MRDWGLHYLLWSGALLYGFSLLCDLYIYLI